MVWKSKAYWAAVGLILAATVYSAVLRSARVESSQKPDLSLIPLAVGPWQGELQSLGAGVYEALRVDDSRYVRYVRPSGEMIWLFIGYFRNQECGAQIHSPRHCLPGGGWKILDQQRYRLNERLPLTYLLISNEQERDVMLYWYETRRGRLSSEFGLKFDLLVNSLFRRPTAAAFVRFNMPIARDDPHTTRSTLEEFILKLVPSIDSQLGFTSLTDPSDLVASDE